MIRVYKPKLIMNYINYLVNSHKLSISLYIYEIQDHSSISSESCNKRIIINNRIFDLYKIPLNY